MRFQTVRGLYTPPPDTSPPFINDEDKPDFFPWITPKDKGQLSCQIPLCGTCAIAKARRRAPRQNHTTPNVSVVDKIRADDLQPGDCFSVDQYESSVRGRLTNTQGRESQSSKHCGGTIFFDHASGKIFVRHQPNLTGTATVLSKRDVERECLTHGVIVKKYHTDNGVFKSTEFENSLEEDEQWMTRSASGAHHQNAVPEQAIGTVSNMAQAMLMHMRLHWPEEFDPTLRSTKNEILKNQTPD